MDISTIGQPKRRRSSTVPEQSAINQSDRNSHRDINSNNGVYNRSEFEDKGENTMSNWDYESRFSTASGNSLPYVVMQVTLKEKFWGTGSKNLTDLAEVINAQVAKGYRLHTMSTSNGGSKGFGGGDRIQATLVFERLDMR